MQHHAARIERLGAFHLATFLQNQLEYVTNVFIWTEHVCLNNRFPDLADHAWVGQVSGVIDQESFFAGGQHFIHHAGTGGDDVHVVFAPEPFLNDLHVKQTKKSATKTKAQSNGAFRLIDKGGIVQAQLSDCGLQMFEVTGVNRIDAAEDHGMNFLKAEKRDACRMPLVSDGVADLYVSGRFDVCDEITDVAGIQPFLHAHLGRKYAHLLDLVARVVPH